MIDLAFNNIRRQRTRTFLTVLGIIIGIGAVVSLGSISSGLRVEIEKSLEISAGKITVSEKGAEFITGFTGSELNDEDLDSLASISGVKDVVPLIYYFEGVGVGFGGPEWVAVGMPPDKQEYFTGETIRIDEGRELEDGDIEVMVSGSNFAARNDLEVGDFYVLKEADLEVVGILEESDISDVDNNFIVPLEGLKDIVGRDTYQLAYVIPEDVGDTEFVAERVEDENEELQSLTSTEIARQASEILDQISLFTLGIGAVAAFVGGLGIMNTMIMSVLERKREIGVMKAIGATRRKIMIHFITEAVLMAAIGGVAGIALGFFGSLALGTLLGFTLAITPALAGGAFVFAVILGLVGGLYPSWQAAKLDPVEALRYE